ncbi:MAG: phosphodiester glycosidase family protein [Proteobacteria bacterium]|nr:phosphodiester glycosidase family protein [Pseudomonadota bacterium]
MRNLIQFILFAACFLCAGTAFGEQVFWGMEYWQESVGSTNPKSQMFIIKIDLQAKGIRPFVTPELNGKLLNTSSFLSNYGVQAGINTAFFDMGGTNKAMGYFVSNGTPYVNHYPDDWRPTIGFTQSNQYLYGAGSRGSMYNACSGSHVLVENGQAVNNGSDSFSVTTHPRTAAGIDKSGRYFFMIVVDGRSKQSTGMSLATLSQHMIRLGIYQGINLDGGGSSTMVIQGKGLVNRPTGGTYQRPVASHLGFFANSSCQPSEEVCNGYDDDCDNLVNEDGVCEATEDPQYQSAIYDAKSTDVDGDGKADICARGAAGIYCSFSSGGDMTAFQLVLELSNDSGWADVSNYSTIQFADYNDDGKADICARADAGVMCWVSTGTGFGDATEIVPMTDADGYNDVKYYSTIRFADINGDGRDDFCARYKEGYRCYPSQGMGWGEGIELGDMADSTGWGNPEYYSTIRTGDVNGDGRVDVCARGSAGFRCWLSEGDKFAPDFVAAAWSNANGWNYPRFYETIRMADLNGDHKADICARDSGGITCHLSEGTAMGAAFRGPDFPDNQGWNDYDNYSTLRFGDIDGDGKDDLCIRANARLVCYPSTGSGFGSAIAIDDMSDANGWNQPKQYRTIRMADVNGDGKTDVCGRNADGVRCYLSNGTGFDIADGPGFRDSSGWGAPEYYSTLRIGGPVAKPCSFQAEVCDGKDNNCDGQTDENFVCCKPSEEVCDGEDNDCDGDVDEGDVCCEASEEICDGKDNDCDGDIDEDGVCDQCKPSREICDGKDNDCDGDIDEGGVCDSSEPSEPSEPTEDDGPMPHVSFYYDDDCGCSLTGNPTPPGALCIIFIAGGFFLYRRRRRDKS